MSLARELSRRVAALRYEEMPAEAIYWGKVAVLDTVGVTLAGAVEAAPRIVEDVLALPGDGGSSLIFGTKRRASCLDAALVNGTAAHMLDFDNTCPSMGGHVSATMIPALLAAGEAFGVSGRNLLLAHAAGFEVGARLGRALNVWHTDKGWHPTATLGIFAVAAACARLLELSAEQTTTAFALSASMAAGIKVNFGTMTKPLHAGQAARCGLQAVLLARKGFTANAEAFEHKQGFFNVFNGAGNFRAEDILEGWAQPLEIVSPGACYKQFPCCGSTHTPIEAALRLVGEHGTFAVDEIERVDSFTHASRLVHTDRPLPQGELEAKFSVQYCVARALLQGTVTLRDFEGDAYRDPVVRTLLPRVHAVPSNAEQFPPDNRFGAEVRVTLKDGRMMAAKIERALGRTSANPIPVSGMKDKFASCASRALTAEGVAAAARMIDTFDALERVRDFTDLLQTHVVTGHDILQS